MKGNPYSDRDQVNEISHLIKPPCCLYMTAGRSLCSVSLRNAVYILLTGLKFTASWFMI